MRFCRRGRTKAIRRSPCSSSSKRLRIVPKDRVPVGPKRLDSHFFNDRANHVLDQDAASWDVHLVYRQGFDHLAEVDRSDSCSNMEVGKGLGALPPWIPLPGQELMLMLIEDGVVVRGCADLIRASPVGVWDTGIFRKMADHVPLGNREEQASAPMPGA